MKKHNAPETCNERIPAATGTVDFWLHIDGKTISETPPKFPKNWRPCVFSPIQSVDPRDFTDEEAWAADKIGSPSQLARAAEDEDAVSTPLDWRPAPQGRKRYDRPNLLDRHLRHLRIGGAMTTPSPKDIVASEWQEWRDGGNPMTPEKLAEEVGGAIYEEQCQIAQDDERRDTLTLHAERYKRLGLAAMQRAARMGEWQPIETCPPMRTVLLFAVTDEENGFVKNWKMASGFYHKGYEGQEGRTPWNWEGRYLATYDVKPSHWMPLPASPPPPGKDAT